MAHQQSARFLRIVEDAKKRVRVVSIEDTKARLDCGDKFVLVDVREESEYAKDHEGGDAMAAQKYIRLRTMSGKYLRATCSVPTTISGGKQLGRM